jgi:hypothetical protein
MTLVAHITHASAVLSVTQLLPVEEDGGLNPAVLTSAI